MTESADRIADDQPPFRYDARLANEIELHWQEYWATQGTFNTPNPTGPLSGGFDAMAGRPKFYVMDMFPYPSGAGLHVGHPLGYIGTDVYARYLRMRGYNVLHPFGYDAFGLPAEQYAIDTGQHPAITTQQNITNMRRQLRRLGLGHDQRREFATTDVTFYRWTQWIFLKIFNSWFDVAEQRARPIEELIAEYESRQREPVHDANPDGRPWAELTEVQRRTIIDGHRLAYISQELVNWCPGLGTVLANEEITADGRSDIGNYPVYRRPLRQWMLRITAYAERLLADLDPLDWTDSIKTMQRNWIGPSDGASIEFAVADSAAKIRVYTTRPDTLAGATYMVLAPEHPLVDQLTAGASWPQGTPEQWRYPEGAGAAGAGDPGWTPALAVQKYRESAARVSDRQRTDEGYDKTGVFTGGYAINPMTQEPLPVFVADYVLMGYGTGAIMAVPAHDERDHEFAHRFGLPIRAVLEPPADWCEQQGVAPGAPAGDWPAAYVGEHGYVDLHVPGLDLAGLGKQDAIRAAIGWLEDRDAGHYQRSYRLRDWLFSRQRYWGEPFPIVYDETGMPVALPDNLLPVELPDMTEFRPEPQQDETSDPVPPLARVKDWVEVELDFGDGPKRYRRELNTMPQWAGSCWYYLRYLDPTDAERFVEPGDERYWMVPAGAESGDGGVDLYVGGVEHAVLHLLYSRFWHKILFDLGFVSTKEPFKRLYNQGYIQADAYLDGRGMYVPAAEVTREDNGRYSYQGEPVTARSGKMGKSLKNAVAPDDIYAAYGADTLRLYEMGMGPLDTDRPWQTDDMVGVYRFLQRLWRSTVDEQTGELLIADKPLDDEMLRMLHRTIKVVRRDFDDLRFNTAIARLTELNNFTSRLAARDGFVPRGLAEPIVLMVAPLAPHIAETLWARMGHAESLAYESFPEFDEALAAEKSVVLPVQVNGKRRFQIEVAADADEEQIRAHLTAQPEYAQHTEGLTVQRVVIVPGRIVNIVAR
ncbi:MAG TPA: class I tRNA ligase family protein [Streptosporangiaceae bacterium]|jgi:leucyl-tRNA synthetase